LLFRDSGDGRGPAVRRLLRRAGFGNQLRVDVEVIEGDVARPNISAFVNNQREADDVCAGREDGKILLRILRIERDARPSAACVRRVNSIAPDY
jgi:hypothetical protein